MVNRHTFTVHAFTGKSNLERFAFASPTGSRQPRVHGLQIIGVFPNRVAAKVHSLEASAPGCPQATLALPRSDLCVAKVIDVKFTIPDQVC